MTIHYRPPRGHRLGGWYADDPSIEDMENLAFLGGRQRYLNFIVVGKPARISEEWLAKHPMNVSEEGYDYAVSYSIPARTLGYMMDESETVLDAFNMYLEDQETGKEWIDIERIELVDRNYKGGDNAY